MRTSRTGFLATAILAFLPIACVPPDAVVRPDAGFTKASSLTLTTVSGADSVILIPDLERELLRRGFNIISRDVAPTETQTTVVAGDKAAAKVEASRDAYQNNAQASAASAGSSNTVTSTHQVFRSEFVGRVDYLYNPGSMTPRRVNLTITELKTGKIAVSLVFDSGMSHDAAASNIADQLAKVVH